MPSISRPIALVNVAVAVGSISTRSPTFWSLAPGAHHEGVVHRQAGDRVDALRPDLVGPHHEAREVVVRAGRGERARHREEHDLALAERLARGDRPRALVGHGPQLDVGDLVADWAIAMRRLLLRGLPRAWTTADGPASRPPGRPGPLLDRLDP